jgi:plasmid stability protein
MSQILIRDLSEQTVEQLKKRAKRNRRSLQAEVRLILEDAALRGTGPGGRMSIEELVRLADEIRARSGPQRTESTEILRRIRDA